MTFTAIKQAVKDFCVLSSPEADTRIGQAINQTYRRITATLGLDASRFVTRTVSTTAGVATVTFTEIETIDRIIDTTSSSSIRALTEVGLHEIRAGQPGTGDPMRWAVQEMDADSVTIVMDTLPQSTYTLQADGKRTLSTLSGNDEPSFPESFHNMLVWEVISEELLKKEKDKLAGIYAKKADDLLRDLRFQLADSPTRDTTQANGGTTSGTAGASGGGGTSGATSYTQYGLLTFDRGAGIAPYAVTRTDAPYVANLGAEFLGNIASDRIIGRDTAGTGETEQLTLTGGLEFTGAGGIQVANGGISYARMQDVSAASRVLGRGSASGSGDPEELTLVAPLSVSTTTLVVDTQSDQFVLCQQVFS